ncbi:MAG TPA: DUF6401 family natural product biosynthesis protein [Streptosporangiaceae bacterium]|nr:DUF6401 family natural product biosynthesis protein [Streptosporangiaceae bacterium]
MAERTAPLSPAALRLAGHVGQTALDRVAARGVAIAAELDQHVAAVRAEVAACQERPVMGAEPAAEPARATCPDVPFAATALHTETTVPVELLLHYASGFVQAALGDGWVPAASADADDWVSLRLAAICQLIRQAEAAASVHPDLRAIP